MDINELKFHRVSDEFKELYDRLNTLKYTVSLMVIEDSNVYLFKQKHKLYLLFTDDTIFLSKKYSTSVIDDVKKSCDEISGLTIVNYRAVSANNVTHTYKLKYTFVEFLKLRYDRHNRD